MYLVFFFILNMAQKDRITKPTLSSSITQASEGVDNFIIISFFIDNLFSGNKFFNFIS